MRNIRNTGMRLIMLHAHLENANLQEKYESMLYLFSDDKKNVIIGNGNGKFYVIYPFIVHEMPKLFSEFKEDQHHYVKFHRAPGIDIYYAIMEYLGLSVDEFLHLFSPGTQNIPKYGGRELTVDSTCKDVAFNIYCMFDRALKERKQKEKIFTSEVLIEKKTKNKF